VEQPSAVPQLTARARIVVIPREDDPADALPSPGPGRPRTGVRPIGSARAVERPFERGEDVSFDHVSFDHVSFDEQPPGGDADLPVGVDASSPGFWSVPARQRQYVRYASSAWVVSGDRSIEGRCDGIGVDGVLLQVPMGQVLVDTLVVCLTLPLSSALVPVPCVVDVRTRGLAGREVLSCHFTLLPRDVEREIELYVNALTSR